LCGRSWCFLHHCGPRDAFGGRSGTGYGEKAKARSV
jgi:hypothetical protein